MRALLPAALALGLLLAGCLTASRTAPPGPDPLSAANRLPAKPTGKGARDYVDKFPMQYPFRLRELPTHQAARDYLEKELKSFGLEVVRQKYDAGVNILGVKNGTALPSEWIVLSAHYDTAETTAHAAWDDGAGSAALLEMAKAYAQGSWKRTLVFAFFDGEEQGLEGSKAFVTEYTTRHPDVTLAANLNFDPPGLNWPCRNPDGTLLPMTVMHSKLNSSGQQALVAAILRAKAAVGVPDANWEYIPTGVVAVAAVNGQGLRGTSDFASFGKVGVANLDIGGSVATVAGPVTAMTYGLHTPVDTLQQMDARCGDAATLEKGFQAALDLTTPTLLEADALPSALLLAQEAS
jgi:Zn-dependent M28 family amino/carboxypeptidase